MLNAEIKICDKSFPSIFSSKNEFKFDLKE